jgi:hypothetical protein
MDNVPHGDPPHSQAPSKAMAAHIVEACQSWSLPAPFKVFLSSHLFLECFIQLHLSSL